jgi:DNA modification methylase
MKPNTIYEGDCIETMKQWDAGCVQTCITSPPYYGLRDYGHEGQIGLEETPEAFVAKMVEVFREVKRVLRDDGTLWLNLGDSYAGNNSQASNNGRAGYGNERERIVNRTGNGLKTKDLIGIPWMVAFALRADGWYLRQDIIWHKPNPMPESVTDRCTKAHEYIFLFSKSQKYHFDNEAIKEQTGREGGAPRVFGAKKQEGTLRQDIGRDFVDDGTRNKRSVWTVTTKPYSGAHFATFPPDLIEPCILAGAPEGGVVLDPFMGSGTTAHTALRAGRQYVGCELNGEYIKLANKRLSQGFLL